MADLILKVLDSCEIEKDKVLTITSDNASNNGTLVKCMNDALDILRDEFGLKDEFGQLSRVPCLAHVIQLALKELVVYLKIKPKNNKVISEWFDDEQDRENHSTAQQNDKIPWTLKKVRSISNIIIIIVLIIVLIILDSRCHNIC
jgi:hypothetical protein